VNHFLVVALLISSYAAQARAETPSSPDSAAGLAKAVTPPGGWPLSTHAGELLLTVANGVTLFDEPRNDLRAALGPEAGSAIGLDHPGFPSPCERAVAADLFEINLRVELARLDAAEQESRAQEIEWAKSMIPAEGLRFRGGRVLTGDAAIRWILAHPADFDPNLAHRQVLKSQARAAFTKMLRMAAADVRAANRACRVGR
jgi:hypothetical protein